MKIVNYQIPTNLDFVFKRLFGIAHHHSIQLVASCTRWLRFWDRKRRGFQHSGSSARFLYLSTKVSGTQQILRRTQSFTRRQRRAFWIKWIVDVGVGLRCSLFFLPSRLRSSTGVRSHLHRQTISSGLTRALAYSSMLRAGGSGGAYFQFSIKQQG